jgi:hypothetical protein
VNLGRRLVAGCVLGVDRQRLVGGGSGSLQVALRGLAATHRPARRQDLDSGTLRVSPEDARVDLEGAVEAFTGELDRWRRVLAELELGERFGPIGQAAVRVGVGVVGVDGGGGGEGDEGLIEGRLRVDPALELVVGAPPQRDPAVVVGIRVGRVELDGAVEAGDRALERGPRVEAGAELVARDPLPRIAEVVVGEDQAGRRERRIGLAIAARWDEGPAWASS